MSQGSTRIMRRLAGSRLPPGVVSLGRNGFRVTDRDTGEHKVRGLVKVVTDDGFVAGHVFPCSSSAGALSVGRLL